MKFIAERNLLVVSSDDLKLRVYNYNTIEKVKEIDAHSDLIRSIVIHPKENLMASCSDDNSRSYGILIKGLLK